MKLQLYFNCCVFADDDSSPAQLSLEFRVFLVSAQTGKHTQENRTLQFWFAASTSDADNATVAQEFFRELVSPQDFPRGEWYGFICSVVIVLCTCARLLKSSTSRLFVSVLKVSCVFFQCSDILYVEKECCTDICTVYIH
jgi:hypothetical protein